MLCHGIDPAQSPTAQRISRLEVVKKNDGSAKSPIYAKFLSKDQLGVTVWGPVFPTHGGPCLERSLYIFSE